MLVRLLPAAAASCLVVVVNLHNAPSRKWGVKWCREGHYTAAQHLLEIFLGAKLRRAR